MSFMSLTPTTEKAVRTTRNSRIVRARLCFRDGEEEDIVVCNVTPTGLGARSKSSAPVRGERVVIMLPGDQRVDGVVRWFSGRSFGVQLDQTLDMNELSTALQHQSQATRAANDWQVGALHRVVTPPQADPTRIRRL